MCFWRWTWWTGLPLKYDDRCGLEIISQLNSNSWTWFEESGLKFIFHCTAFLEICGNKDVPFVKSFKLDCKQFYKLFKHIKKNKTPTLILVKLLHSLLFRTETDHLKLLVDGNFSKSSIRDTVACLLCPFVLIYMSIVFWEVLERVILYNMNMFETLGQIRRRQQWAVVFWCFVCRLF